MWYEMYFLHLLGFNDFLMMDEKKFDTWKKQYLLTLVVNRVFLSYPYRSDLYGKDSCSPKEKKQKHYSSTLDNNHPCYPSPKNILNYLEGPKIVQTYKANWKRIQRIIKMHNAHCILIMHVIVCLENVYKFRIAFGYIIILGQFVDINDVSLPTFNFIGCKP